MRNMASITLDGTAQNLKDAIGDRAPQEASLLIMQAPSANGNIAYFGNSALQLFELAAGDPFYYVPADIDSGRINLGETYIKGTASDKLTVAWIPYGEVE